MVRSTDFVEEVLRPFATNYLLLNGLVRSEVADFRAEKHLQWQVEYNGVSEVLSSRGTVQASSLRLRVGIAGGYLGIQAFYMFLENFWRNLVKHNSDPVRRVANHDGADKITIHVALSDVPSKPFYRASIWADAESDNAHEVRNRINGFIKSGLTDRHGEVKPGGWGTKEMLVSAALLVGAELSDVQEHGSSILACVLHDGKYLAYEFFIPKTQVALLVTETSVTLEGMKPWLEGCGISVMTDVPNAIVPTEYIICTDELPSIAAGLVPMKVSSRVGLARDIPEDPGGILDMLVMAERDFARKLIGLERPIDLFVCRSKDLQDGNLIDSLEDDGLHCRAISRAQEREILRATSNGHAVAVFDRHGELNPETNDEARSVLGIRPGHLVPPESVFWEPYSGGSHTEFLFQHLPEEKKARTHMVWSIISSAFLKVLIIDERLQELLESPAKWESFHAPIEPAYCLELMGIYVPRRKDRAKSPETRNEVLCSLQKPEKGIIDEYIASKSPHIISVHAGVLDKLGLANRDAVTAWAEETMKLMDDNIHRIVIHSGRGIPGNVPVETVPFVSYSAIEHWTANERIKSKHGLVQELLAARAIVRNDEERL